ncbi:MAG: ThuA domain-containing protein [Bacteroidota bacterium]
MKNILFFLLSLICISCGTNKPNVENEIPPKALMKALIIDGQNNHEMWPMTTVMMKQYMEETGLFTVDVARTAFTWKGDSLVLAYPIEGLPMTKAMAEPKADPNFRPNFSAYDVVISNFGWKAAPLPEATQQDLEKYVSSGGGFVVVHAADNSWPEWLEFNKMIALGGWGGRTEKDGPYVYYDLNDELQIDNSEGRGGSHGPQHEYLIIHRDETHPITKGLPKQWLHTQDELYDRLRGPAENLKVLGTAFSDTDKKGTNRHEPKIMTIDYGKGRVFHTTMGHADYSFECVGLMTILKRGIEWAATGKVTQTEVPTDFPTATASSKRKFILKKQ